MKELLVATLAKVTSLAPKEIESQLTTPPDPQMGDYAFPCFTLAKTLKKSPPQIASELTEKIIELLLAQKSSPFEKIEAVGPYINVSLNRVLIAKQTLAQIEKEKKKYGATKNKKQKVMIEYSQANTHKAFHVGHIRGTCLGESIARICAYQGNAVVRANYEGDTGMHVAKWIWCYTKFHANEPLRQDESWIAGLYVEAIKKLEENPTLQAEVDEINKKLENRSDKAIVALWKKSRQLSLKAFEKIYQDLQTDFDKLFFESEMEERSKEIVQELLKKNIARIDQGATIVDLQQYNLGVWILLRKDGTVLYSAKDLALAEEKFTKYKIQKAIYVVGNAQKLHFQQLFKTLQIRGFKYAEDCAHIAFNEVRLPEGKMSSRTGNNILYADFKRDLITEAKAAIQSRHQLPEKELEARAHAIALAALKYAMLKPDANHTIIFDKEEAVRFEGNTGPYLLYAYARANAILRKAKSKAKKYTVADLSEKEKALVMKLAAFPDVVQHAYTSLAPNLIANYAFELAQIFNEFYHASPVVGSEQEAFRLALVRSFIQVLQNALFLLGITPIEHM